LVSFFLFVHQDPTKWEFQAYMVPNMAFLSGSLDLDLSICLPLISSLNCAAYDYGMVGATYDMTYS